MRKKNFVSNKRRHLSDEFKVAIRQYPFTQEELAKKIGVHRTKVSQLLNDIFQPKIFDEVIEKIAREINFRGECFKL